MAIEIVMPRLGWNMEVGTVVEWLKRDGDRVTPGDHLFLVESDKSTTEVESLDGGTLRIPGNDLRMGEELPVGTLLAYLVQDGEAVPVRGTDTAATGAGAASAAPAPVPAMTADPAADSPAPAPAPALAGAGAGGDRARRRGAPVASPRAKRVAATLGVDWTRLNGSSRSGRIVEADVRAALAHGIDGAAAQGAVGSAIGPPTVTPLSPTRRVIGERMARSAHTAAAVTLTTEAGADALVAARADLVAALAGTDAPPPTYNDFFARLVAVALRDFPDLNASLTDDGIMRHAAVHVGLAVDTERGLLVPVLRDVQAKSVQVIAGESARLIAAARAGQSAPADLQGGTFTITNLGPYEIDAFTPIINPPQCAILGIGRIVARPVVADEAAGTIAVRKGVALSLTFDHRIVDGGPAARFLQRIKHYVERPIVWLTR
jgi:pyruvate dehydrogenase E2 component (dihydrolipoamide acetyltransferase)